MLRYSFPEDIVDDLYARPGDDLPGTMTVPFLHMLEMLRERNIATRIAVGGANVDVELEPRQAGGAA